MRKRAYFQPSVPQLAFVRGGPVTSKEIDDVAASLRASRSNISLEALRIINVLAAYSLTLENELGQVYEERTA